MFCLSLKIIGRIDEMGGRIDDLEKSIGDLMEQVKHTLNKLIQYTNCITYFLYL